MRQVTATLSTQTLLATNREKHDLLREGVQVSYRNAEGETVRERLRVIDFDNAENNHFLCVRELWIKGDLYRRRADIVGFVNGLPLVFMECKNIHRNLEAAFEENFSDYMDTIPHLFHHNAPVVFGNGDEVRLGSITSKWEHFHEWKRLHEEDPGVVDMETLLKGVLSKKNLLDLVENFILFKIVARNHQFLGVENANFASLGGISRSALSSRTRRHVAANEMRVAVSQSAGRNPAGDAHSGVPLAARAGALAGSKE